MDYTEDDRIGDEKFEAGMVREALNETSGRPGSESTGPASAFAVAPGSASPWRVSVTVRGDHAGDYTLPNFEEARKLAEERNRKFGVLGCHYRLIPPANECRCCGKPGVYVRTRYFETENADVWECATEGCENFGLIFHTQSSPNDKVTGG